METGQIMIFFETKLKLKTLKDKLKSIYFKIVKLTISVILFV